MPEEIERVLCTMSDDELLDLLQRVSRDRPPAVRTSLTTMAPDGLGGARDTLDPDELATRVEGDSADGDDPDATATVLIRAPSEGTFDEDTALPPVAPDRAAAEPAAEGERYEVLSVLGEGGMGMVLRVRDTHLNRRVAMKVLRPRLLSSHQAVARFREEAQIAGQLQHPGIIPVHDIGRRADGSVFFTMKEVKGKTFEDVIDEVQVALEDGHLRTADGWSFRRLIDVFQRVCETVAYAHHRGVVHRDLKPENIMVGAFGEVLVLDWGLAKILAEEASSEALVTDRSADSSIKTRMGAIAGTPSFMAPEQARGQIHKISPATDVYGLGGILYAILTGRPVYLGRTAREVIDKVAEGEPKIPAHEVPDPPAPVPEELSAIAMRALAFRSADRHPHAGALAEEVAAWLDGAQKREKALEVVAEAFTSQRRAPALRAEADALAARAAAELERLPDDAPLEAHFPAWQLEADARAKRAEAERLELDGLQGLRSALSHAPDLPEAHDALAQTFYAAHRAAEAAGDTREAQRTERELRAHDVRGRYATYLRGDGALTLVTEPAGATARLFALVERNKCLVPDLRYELGRTPLVEVPLARGRWVVELTADGHHPVTYPVLIERLQHWDGVPPGETEPHPIRLPRLGTLAPDDAYVPAGWFWSGGHDPYITHQLPRQRLWCHAMVFKRFPVTMGEYAQWIEALHRAGEHELARELTPQDRGAAYFGWDGERLTWEPDPEGTVADPRWPALLIPYAGVEGYAAWRAAQEGLAWRLPHELEWEKAFRGVDGRAFPWGDAAEARLGGCILPMPNRVDSHPTDVSVYGLRQGFGGVSDWTRDRSPEGRPPVGQRVANGHAHEAAFMLARGGSWADNVASNRVTTRRHNGRPQRNARTGLRLCRAIFFDEA